MSIHTVLLTAFQAALQAALITNVAVDDVAKAGIVVIGPLQGDPDPDAGRITVTIHENDPDTFYGIPSTMMGAWDDEVIEIEIGGSATWARRFSVKARCLLVNTQEGRDAAQAIAATVRMRIEKTLLNFTGFGLHEDVTGEYVSLGVLSDSLRGAMIQAGGPPDSYDYYIKIRFELQTTIGVTL